MKLSTEIVRDLLAYQPDTGVFTWNTRGREWFTRGQDCNRWNNRYAGKEAGCVHKNTHGYPKLVIRVLGKRHIAARLAFLAMGEVMPEQVDHDNGDSLDNRWSNLLASNAAKNQKNCSKRRDNTSGVCGVSWSKSKGKWHSQSKMEGKLHNLGFFDELDDAAAVVLEFRAENGYSARHGQEFSAYQVAGILDKAKPGAAHACRDLVDLEI